MNVITINTENGFSILEILFLISISSILALSFAGNLSKTYQKFLIRRYLIKTESIIENAQFISRLNVDTNIVVNEDELLLQKKDNLNLLRSIKLPNKLKYKLKNTSNNIFSFYKSGVQTPFSLSILSKDITCDLSISLRGRIKGECY